MSSFIVTGPAPKFGKCVSCGENIHNGERRTIAYNFRNNKVTRIPKETYCCGCKGPAMANNPDASQIEEKHDNVKLAVAFAKNLLGDAEYAAEREREDFAAYLAAGATSEYWKDKDAGF